MDHDKIKLAKAIRLPDEGNKSFVYVCKPVKKVKALLTARKLRASSEHLNGPKDGEFSLQEQETFKLQRTISEEALCSRGAGEGYTLSPVEGLAQSTSTTSSQLDSPTLAAMLQRQQQFESKAVGSQDLLRLQLEEVCHRHNNQRQLEKDQYEKEQRQLELDQVSKKLPVLQHEIHMLHKVSEKLEATLRATNIPKPRSNVIITDISRQSSGRFYTPRTSPNQLDELPIRKLCCLRLEYIPAIEMRARIIGTVCHVGFVQEFRIETKTLNELKTADESQCFYLPAPKEEPPLVQLNEDDPLQCTNFRQLRKNPNMLFQQLRKVPGAGGSFNLLDQDTMFFNSLAYADSKIMDANTVEQLEVATREAGGGGATMAHYGGAIAYSRLSVRLNEVGVDDAAAAAAPPTPAVKSEEQGDRLTECPCQVNNTTQTDVELSKLEKIREAEEEISSPDFTPNPSPRTRKRMKVEEPNGKVQEQDELESNLDSRPKKTRKVITRRAPDPPVRCDVEPKVRLKLLKTVLVGMVQIAVILVLIMAIGSPDIIC
uniref:AT07424p n=1 Tax=Drosophila melanogaster TaxID=7227 RepID=Q8MZE6_DROME|nr:AT07424p [Drosophila melanogaster]